MHRTRLGVLVAGLALLLAALVVPRGGATTPGGTPDPGTPADHVSPVAATVPTRAAAVTLPKSVRTAFSEPDRECRSGLVALTFDDGPSASVTMGLVRTLQRLDVPATFFMVGSRVRAEPGIARKVQRAGFQVANHSWSHAQLTAVSRRAARDELTRTRSEFLRQKIVAGNLVRPPYGAANPRTRKLMRKLGLVSVLWSIDSFDWKGGGPTTIANRVLAKLNRNGTNVVLQHDGVNNSPNSAKAVPIIVRKARERGYCFADLDARGKVALPEPRLRVSTLSGTEDGATGVRVKLQLDRPPVDPVSIRLQTVSGTAEAGVDFTPTDRVVTFRNGVSTAWITVPVVDDDETETVEDFWVVLDEAKGLTAPRRDLPATIFSDD